MMYKSNHGRCDQWARVRAGWDGALLCALLVCATGVLAADFGDRTPSVKELVEALGSAKGGARGGVDRADEAPIRTRGLRIAPSSSATAQQQDPARDPAGGAPAGTARVSMQIQFDLNSDRIQSASSNSLSNLAMALNSDALRDQRFQIVGHTDASGAYLHNMKLSERRAKAVREYLVTTGIDPARLAPVGKGPTELLDSAEPYSGKNRRVEIRVSE